MNQSHFRDFHTAVRKHIPETRIFRDDLRRLAYGTDASFYRLIPEIVIKAESEEEVIVLLEAARICRVPVTFRAAGTSLSGQAVTDSALVLLGNAWTELSVQAGGALITLQPGVIGAHANRVLERYGRKIGPDPASINSAMIGGIAANNASGMCCGISQNSYQTLESMRVIFADGAVLDTGDPSSRENFSATHETLVARLLNLRAKVLRNTALAEKIRKKFKMKNTTGYSLNALVDFEDPVDILQHLMIGSEGTLGFIAEITLKTVPDYPFKATSLMLFADIPSACRAAAAFSGLEVSACEDGDIKSPRACRNPEVSAVELMDRASLKSVQNKPGMTFLENLPEDTAALLVEVQAGSKEELEMRALAVLQTVQFFSTLAPPAFSFDTSECAQLWNIRKGLFPSIGAMRETGTTVIIEDIAFPLERLAEGVRALKALFLRHGYPDAIFFGHAMQGNLHFVFTQDFNHPDEVSRYGHLMEDVTRLVAEDYGGSLKAEHGTGRNMAPFVEREWGKEAYGLMQEIKDIFDPDGILNPGVILNEDSKVHVKNLKPLPKADAAIDKCVECGFCEWSCPSKNLTLTPRQRIVVFREMTRLRAAGGGARLRRLEKAFQYQGEQTCAADGVCAINCPVNIDTGRLIKTLRYESHSRLAHAAAGWTAAHMREMIAGARAGLSALKVFERLVGIKTLGYLSEKLLRLPAAAPRFHPVASASGSVPKAVYFPSCLTRTLGVNGPGGKIESLPEQAASLLNKGGWGAVYPAKLENLCCGLAFDSKGFKIQGDLKLGELKACLAETAGADYPVLFDTSPCFMRFKESLESSDFPAGVYEPVGFIAEFLLDKLEIQKRPETIVSHVTCSAKKLGLAGRQAAVLGACAEKVVDTGVMCCGFAGDKGFTNPELTASALENMRAHLPEACGGGYSSSLTCEIGLSLHSGITFRPVLSLVNECAVGPRIESPVCL